jgi:Protein of unknown function (DUF2795)
MYSEVAVLQVLLEGVSLPASKDELIRYAREQNDGRAVALLERLPDREYRRIDEVGEALAPVQPSAHEQTELPHEESGLPPGGDDYVAAHPTPGKVREDAPPGNPPQNAIEQQTKTQKEQKERQAKML